MLFLEKSASPPGREKPKLRNNQKPDRCREADERACQKARRPIPVPGAAVAQGTRAGALGSARAGHAARDHSHAQPQELQLRGEHGEDPPLAEPRTEVIPEGKTVDLGAGIDSSCSR